MHKMARPDETTSLIRDIQISKLTTKCTVHTFFPICYIVLIILAAILKSYIEEWSSLTQANLIVVTSLLISAGTFGLLLSNLCCCNDNTDKVLLYVIYTFVMTLQIAAVVYGFIQIADKNHVLKKTMDADMKNNFNVYSADIKNTFDGIQIEKSCCGVHGVNDYIQLNRKIPISCCTVDENMDKYCSDPSKAYKDGCAQKMYDDIIYNIGILSYTTIGLVVLQIILGIVGLHILHNPR